MAQPYVGEIRMFAGNFAPSGWLFCQGQLLPIVENEVLFALIGTSYGGDGQSTFALPDMRGRLPIHQGSGFTLAEAGGAEEVSLNVNQIPSHNHVMHASTAEGHSNSPHGHVWATTPTPSYQTGGASLTAMPAQTLSLAGGSQPHSNLMPYLCINFIISLFGIFPSQT